MKPDEQRKPFRPVGMRMQRFSQTLMRSYSPPANDLPAAAPMEPIWQPATQIPLSWQNEPVQTIVPAAPVPLMVEAPPAEFEPQPASSEAIQSAITAVSQPTASAPAPQQIQRTAAPPAPAVPQVQRAAAPPAAPEGKRMDPRLLAMLMLHQDIDAERNQIRDEKKAIFSANTEAANGGDNAPIRRKRGSASFDYIETSTLAKGEETSSASRKSETHHDDAPAASESATDAADDDSAPSAQASGPPEISRSLEVTNPESSVTSPEAGFAASADPTISPSADEIIQRAQAPVEVASEDTITPDVPISTPAQPTAAEVIQRAQAPVEVASLQSPVASQDVPPAPPSAAEIIQRVQAPAEVASSQSPVASQDMPPAPIAPAQPTAAEIIQRAQVPVEATSE
ncbi:MAG: hypothetical protein H0X30_15520, partial [Anaerolineae bacterium]|nr:hypothetical protein [Anaerolineae bacterium]